MLTTWISTRGHECEFSVTTRSIVLSWLSAIRRRIEQAYVDKLDGKIPEDFWQRKQADWRAEESDVGRVLQSLETGSHRDFVANATRILELANKAYFLYVKQTPAEKASCSKWLFRTAGLTP